MISRNEIILVTGAKGMVGSAVCKHLHINGFEKILSPSRQELDLLDENQMDSYFNKYNPKYVLMIGAKVGGIITNKAEPLAFMNENIRIQMNLFECCKKHSVEKSLFLGSSCIYPRDCPQPMKEEYLMTGPLEPTNEGYALAKIIGLKMAKYYYQQHGMLTVCPIPCNIYGTNDHFDFQRAHVLSSLVRRFVDAYDDSLNSVTLWGTGKAKREFIHVNDIANVILFFMDKVDTPEIINVGTGVDISIFDLAHLISEIIGFKGEVNWDHSMPDGMPRKCLDISKLTAMGFTAKIGLEEGITKTILEYKKLKNFRDQN